MSDRRAVRSILFVCYGNACRSPMAEALARRKIPGVRVASAGVLPLGFLPPETARTLAEAGYDADGLSSKEATDVLALDADVVIDLCGAWRPPRGFVGRRETWDVADPYRRDAATWRAVRDDLAARIDDLARRLGA